MNTKRYVAILALVLVAAVGSTATAGIHGGQQARTCFPAAKWDAKQSKRPCVRIVRVSEDGSFQFAVSDADGTVRYTSGVGAQDR